MGTCGSAEAPPQKQAPKKAQAPPEKPKAETETKKDEPKKEQPKEQPKKEEPKWDTTRFAVNAKGEAWTDVADCAKPIVYGAGDGKDEGQKVGSLGKGAKVMIADIKGVVFKGVTYVEVKKVDKEASNPPGDIQGWVDVANLSEKEPVITEEEIVPEKAKAAAVKSLNDGAAEVAGKTDKDAHIWEAVSQIWKDEDKQQFSKAALEKYFPGKPAEKEARNKIWKDLDPNGNGLVSLAEYDNWFNKYTIKMVKENDPTGAAGELAGPGKSDIYVFAKKGLIRAFNLANGVAKGKVTIGGKDVGDDYVTKPELRLLMVATQAVLVITRLFDMMDDTGDFRVGQTEWNANLKDINEEGRELVGDGWKDITEGDFLEADKDNAGGILLDEAVYFLLPKICTDPKLIAESAEEGC